MKTLRITTALLIALAAAACSAPPTGPSLEAPPTVLQMEGTGFLGGGTR